MCIVLKYRKLTVDLMKVELVCTHPNVTPMELTLMLMAITRASNDARTLGKEHPTPEELVLSFTSNKSRSRGSYEHPNKTSQEVWII